MIFHIDEMEKWQLVLKNVSNLLNVVNAAESNIEVLANSEAVKFYKIETFDKELERLNNSGVKFVACNNAVEALNIKKNELCEFVKIVPVGVLEIINREKKGYAYIKP